MPFIQVVGRKTFVHVEGEGPPLLLIHGFPLDHTMWENQIRHFARTHQVIAPDLRGFGQTEIGEGDDAVGMAEYADELKAVLDALNIDERVHVCGLSMGGYIAWQFIEKYRQDLWSAILCDTRAAADTPEAQKTRHETADKVLREGPGFLAHGMIEKLFSRQTRTQRPEIIASVQDVIRRASKEGVAAASRGMAERPDVTARLPLIDAPVLVIGGAEDTLTPPEEMRSFAEKIPNGRFVEIAHAGHLAPLENPDAVNAAMEEFFATLDRVEPK